MFFLSSILMLDLTDYDKLGNSDYESFMYMYEKSWKDLKPHWDGENTTALQNKIAIRAKKEYKKGDYWVEQYVLNALEIVGAGNDEAEKVTVWLKKQYK